MPDDKNQEYIKEFTKYCDFFLVRLRQSKEELAGKIGIDPAYFSRIYNGANPVTKKVINKLSELYQQHINEISPVETPQKIAVQENLPLHPNQMMERIAKLEALVDQDHKEKNELLERVAVLAKDMERAKNDSEKKIRGIVAEAIRDEAERIATELSDRSSRRRETANG